MITKMNNTNSPLIKEKRFFEGVLNTENAFGDNVKDLSKLEELLSGKIKNVHHHPLTGPIVFEDAKKGDYLKVQIKKININYMAQCLSKSAGIAPVEVETFGNRAALISKYNKESGLINYCHGISIPYKPMLGIIGTALENEIRTGHASKAGGNLDLPFVTENTTIYLPVHVDGAYFYIGDAHANQAYGELGGIALEASAEVHLAIEVIKSMHDDLQSIIIIGKEPYADKMAMGIVGVGNDVNDVKSAIENGFNNAVNVLGHLLPEFNDNTIKNMLTIFGHSFLGQAFSKTAESTSVINILESDLKHLFNNKQFNVSDIEDLLFCKIKEQK